MSAAYKENWNAIFAKKNVKKKSIRISAKKKRETNEWSAIRARKCGYRIATSTHKCQYKISINTLYSMTISAVKS